MKLNLASGAHPLDGFANLTPPDWHFQDGLNQYASESVEGITESHGLMFLPFNEWPALFTEIHRVLVPGGVVRITEDATDDPRSERYGGFAGAVALTTRGLVAKYIAEAGLRPAFVQHDLSCFHDLSLVQSWHGKPPKVFHVEGVKPVVKP